MFTQNKFFARVAIYLITCIAGLGVAELTGSAQEIQSLVRQYSIPIQLATAQRIQSIKTPISSFFIFWNQLETYRELELAYANLQAQLVHLEQLEQENQELRSQLGVESEKKTQGLLTKPVLSYPYRLIKHGTQSDIKTGDLVLVNGTLVGRLGEVNLEYSRVILLSDQDASAIIGITNLGQRGVVRGTDQQLVLTEIPQTATVSSGDRVMSAGEKGVKPGVFIGTIGKELTKPTDAVKTFVIDQINTFDTARLVEIQ